MEKKIENQEGVSTKILAKTGIWYTVCNFLFKAIVFLATPFYARIMSKTDMGEFTNFVSWAMILEAITGLNLHQSIILLKVENDEDIDSFVFSILALTSVVTVAVFGVIFLFPSFFTELFGFSEEYVYVLFLYLFFSVAYQLYITRERAYYRYKGFVAMTGIVILSTVGLSLALLVLLDNKLLGRILGNYLPYAVMGLILYVILAVKGKRIKLTYWKTSLKLCIPLVPHVLALDLLSGSDKIIVTKVSGSEITALYGMAFTVFSIVRNIFDSMNKAWAPWLIENLHREKYAEIKKFSRIFIAIFLVLVMGSMLIAPEILLVLGGRKYLGSQYCLPPLMVSSLLIFIYTMYVNVEFFSKKTGMVSFATIIATVANIVMNMVFVPMSSENGHIIAAYTSLVGYVLLFLLHFFLVKRLKMDFIYDTKYNFAVVAGAFVAALLINFLYRITWLRYGVILVMAVAVAAIMLKYKDVIMAKIRAKKGKA